uniref:Small ribosomal subunit protein bS20c n=1 Tax=Sheathia arcuata TaxID=340433 RepID=A0A3G1I967_9FLOR|nr:SSU ribosomal protein S20 [Sheathia arcuata]ART65487.1 SSU ribosomal protein S20 [Sheathia arcuata]
MPKKISVIKRIAISERNYKRNKIYKSMIKTLTKKYLISISVTKNDIDLKYLQIALSNLYSKIDKAVKRGVFHPNNGSRKKASLFKALKSGNFIKTAI